MGIASVKRINDRLLTMKESDIIWTQNNIVFFSNGQIDVNASFNLDKRNFLVEFIAYYFSTINFSDFNYEVFYDFYYSIIRSGDYDNPTILNFCNEFRKKYNLDNSLMNDNVNLLSTFNDGYNQLIRSLLDKVDFYENNTANLEYEPYDKMLKYFTELIQSGYKIHIHTLNHDLLFDHIGRQSRISDFFCDGFSELGQSYYGSLRFGGPPNMEYYVRLKSFQNIYDNSNCFYKLHGSIDTYNFSLANPYFDYTRIKTNYLVDNFLKEVKDSKTGKYLYKRAHRNAFPDFLSGTTEKLLKYSDPYYDVVFKHFRKNLNKAEKLIIIGYGFRDSGINDIIKSEYLQKKSFQPVVIDPFESTEQFYKDNKFNLLKKSISIVTFNDFMSF